jgi:SpoVK/Ycf46/Vps4 family AAA+-type ATPase
LIRWAPAGILLCCPRSIEKALLTKVVMKCSLTFFSVKGPELLDTCVRKSEAKFQRAFQRARDVGPGVVVFDKWDFVALKRGGNRYERAS